MKEKLPPSAIRMWPQAADQYPVYMLSRDGDLTGLDMVQVKWASSSDSQANLEKKQQNFKDLLADYNRLRPRPKQNNDEGDTTNTGPRDTHLPKYIRQGRYLAEPRHEDTWALTKRVRDSVKLDPTERNPDRDINPPRQYLIQKGIKRGSGPLESKDTAFVYQPDGRCLGTIGEKYLARLYTQYEYTKENEPSLHHDLGATTFARRR